MVNGIETITYEPDARHVDLVLKHLGLEKARGVDTPGEKQPIYSNRQTLSKQDSTLYRSCTMTCSYLAADVPALQFSSNRLARGTNQPTVGQMMRLKRVGRYFRSHPRWVQRFPLQEMVDKFDVFGDSGRLSSRKSKSFPLRRGTCQCQNSWGIGK